MQPLLRDRLNSNGGPLLAPLLPEVAEMSTEAFTQAVGRSLLSGLLFGAMLVVPASAALAQDNTGANKTDRQQGMPTADQAKNNTSDRELMSRIRKSVVADKDLSSYGHNCKIIAQNGKVTLRGPVRSEEERRTIEQKAREVAGDGNVDNQLTVKPGRQ